MFKKALTAAVILAGMASAQVAVSSTSNQVANASSLATDLNIGATVRTALAFEIVSAGGGTDCAITQSGASPTASFSLNFGNVDALGISTPTCGTKAFNSTGGAGYLYLTNYKYIARFSGFTATNATAQLKAQVTSQTLGGSAYSGTDIQVWEGASGSPAAIPAGGATLSSAGFATDTTNTGVSRVIGLKLLENNGASAAPGGPTSTSKAYTATVTYTLAPN